MKTTYTLFRLDAPASIFGAGGISPVAYSSDKDELIKRLQEMPKTQHELDGMARYVILETYEFKVAEPDPILERFYSPDKSK
jgi:hypothetical protein